MNVDEKKLKELADALWDSVIHFQATQESVAAAIREAYEEGWHQGYRDAPSDEF